MPTPYRYDCPTQREPKATLPNCVASLFDKISGGSAPDGGLLNLEGWDFVAATETEHDVIIYAVSRAEPDACRLCGAPPSLQRRWGYYDLTFLYDSPIRSKRTRIYYRARRFRCQNVVEGGHKCNSTAGQAIPSVDKKWGATCRLVSHVEKEVFRPTRTFLSVSDETGMPESTLRNLFTERAIQLEAQRVIEAPRWLAIDEVNLPRRVYKHAYCVLSDPLKRRLVDILKDDKQETLLAALMSLPDRDNIEVISIDFCLAYRGVIESLLKNTTIVIDRRHAQEMVRRAFKAFIKELCKKKGNKWCQANMRDPAPLFKRYHELNKEKCKGQQFSELEFVEQWLEHVPELKVGYWLKEEFCNLYELSSSQEALQCYDKWEVRALAVSPAFNSVARTVQLWRPLVFNYNDFKDRFSINVTNGPAEAVNKIIKRVRRLCIRLDFYTLRAKLIHGDFFVKRRPPHPLDPIPAPKLDMSPNNKKDKIKNSKKKPSPKANTERLRRAYEANSEAQELIRTQKERKPTQPPMKHDGFAKRFKDLEKTGVRLSAGMENNAGVTRTPRRRGGPVIGSQYESRKPFQPTEREPEQLTMF